MKELEKILELDKRIKHVAKVSYAGDLLEFLDSNHNSIPNKKFEKILGMNSVLLLDIQKRLNNGFGDVSIEVAIRPENISATFYDENIYEVSFEKDENYSELIEKISDSIHEN